MVSIPIEGSHTYQKAKKNLLATAAKQPRDKENVTATAHSVML